MKLHLGSAVDFKVAHYPSFDTLVTPSLLLFLCSGLAFAASAATFPQLTYSTYLRDSFTPTAIATDASGNIYMAGTAVVDPSTMQTTVLVVKLNPQASQYLYVRYVGGSISDYGNAIAVDSAGDAYVAGYTNSPDFPDTTGTPAPVAADSTWSHCQASAAPPSVRSSLAPTTRRGRATRSGW